MYRPVGWEENKFYIAMRLTEGGGSVCDPYKAIEAGADAMLEALKAEGIDIDGDLAELLSRTEKGILCVIPDEV